MDEWEITGQRLRRTPSLLAKNILRAGVRKGAQIIRDQARANVGTAPGPAILTGALHDSIRVVERRGSPTRVSFTVIAGQFSAGQTKRFTAKYGAVAAFYAYFVEHGHINRQPGDALRGRRAQVQAARAVSIDNTEAHPYMAPALAQKRVAAIGAVANECQNRLGELAP